MGEEKRERARWSTWRVMEEREQGRGRLRHSSTQDPPSGLYPLKTDKTSHHHPSLDQTFSYWPLGSTPCTQSTAAAAGYIRKGKGCPDETPKPSQCKWTETWMVNELRCSIFRHSSYDSCKVSVHLKLNKKTELLKNKHTKLVDSKHGRWMHVCSKHWLLPTVVHLPGICHTGRQRLVPGFHSVES